MDEVEAPSLIRTLRLAAGLPLDDHLAPPRLFAAQSQPFLAIEAVNDIAPNYQALALEQTMHPPVAIPHPCAHDLVHALAQVETRIPREGLALGRSMLARHRTGRRSLEP
jgi:hypothetical protein